MQCASILPFSTFSEQHLKYHLKEPCWDSGGSLHLSLQTNTKILIICPPYYHLFYSFTDRVPKIFLLITSLCIIKAALRKHWCIQPDVTSSCYEYKADQCVNVAVRQAPSFFLSSHLSWMLAPKHQPSLFNITVIYGTADSQSHLHNCTTIHTLRAVTCIVMSWLFPVHNLELFHAAAITVINTTVIVLKL